MLNIISFVFIIFAKNRNIVIAFGLTTYFFVVFFPLIAASFFQYGIGTISFLLIIYFIYSSGRKTLIARDNKLLSKITLL